MNAYPQSRSSKVGAFSYLPNFQLVFILSSALYLYHIGIVLCNNAKQSAGVNRRLSHHTLSVSPEAFSAGSRKSINNYGKKETGHANQKPRQHFFNFSYYIIFR